MKLTRERDAVAGDHRAGKAFSRIIGPRQAAEVPAKGIGRRFRCRGCCKTPAICPGLATEYLGLLYGGVIDADHTRRVQVSAAA